MIDNTTATTEATSVDDVRRIREQFSKESGGDLRKHVEQTLQAFEPLRQLLNLEVVPLRDVKKPA